MLVAGAVIAAVVRNRKDFAATLSHVGVGGIALSLAFGLIGVAATGMQWRAVLDGLGIHFGAREMAGIFFVSQLGKYLPGSVWPIVMQMEAGKARGASRKTIVAANLITIVLGLATGLLVAGLLLPWASPTALRRFWWTFAALPLVLLLAAPRSLPWLLDRALRLARRQPLGVRMTQAATLRASAWAIVSWCGLGLHLLALCAAVGHLSVGLVALCIGGIGLAVTAGVLFIPAPAGAGLREVVLGYVLVSVMSSGQAVAVVVASRVILILVDVILAAVAATAMRTATRQPASV